MKFSSQITINRPINEVFRYTLNPKNMHQWVDGFKSYRMVKGKMRNPGNVLIHVYEDKAGQLEVREQVLSLEKGKSFRSKLSHKNMSTVLEYRFLDQGGSTKIITDTQVRLKPFIFNIFSFFVKGPMKKQQQTDFQRLKNQMEQHK